jgi:hypothetical protein
MITRLTAIIALATTLASGIEAEPEWVKIHAKPSGWPDSLPLLTQQQSLLVLEMPAAIHLRGFAVASRRHPGRTELQFREQAAGLIETLSSQKKVDLKIEWLPTKEAPVDFTRAIQPERGITRSSHRLDGSKITRTVVVDEAARTVFIHLLSDKPGTLSFRVILSVSGEGEPEIEDRRQLVRPAAAGASNSLGAHVWVLPFESDVAPDGNTIVVRGEGEALIILTFATGEAATQRLAETLERLGNRYDPGHRPADPSKIWQGVAAGHFKSIENSP